MTQQNRAYLFKESQTVRLLQYFLFINTCPLLPRLYFNIYKLSIYNAYLERISPSVSSAASKYIHQNVFPLYPLYGFLNAQEQDLCNVSLISNQIFSMCLSSHCSRHPVEHSVLCKMLKENHHNINEDGAVACISSAGRRIIIQKVLLSALQ